MHSEFHNPSMLICASVRNSYALRPYNNFLHLADILLQLYLDRRKKTDKKNINIHSVLSKYGRFGNDSYLTLPYYFYAHKLYIKYTTCIYDNGAIIKKMFGNKYVDNSK